MMTRKKDGRTGTVHFLHPADVRLCLCGVPCGDQMDEDLFGKSVFRIWPNVTDVVTCKDCAKVYCAVKNEPWNTTEPFDQTTLESGIYAQSEKGGD